MSDTEVGMVTEVREIQKLKATERIADTDDGMETVVREVHELNK